MADGNSGNSTERTEGAPAREAPTARTAFRDGPELSADEQSLPWSGPFGWLADRVARINVGMHSKLLTGFLIGAVLLLVLGALSLVVISRMSGQVEELSTLQRNVDLARQMNYLVTAQSHFRAMALLTADDSWNVKIDNAKQAYSVHLAAVEGNSSLDQTDFFADVREVNGRFTESSSKALALYNGGDLDESLRVHLDEEHPVSHELETAMAELISSSTGRMNEAITGFESDRRLLSVVVWSVSGVSLASALRLGVVLSFAFIRPVRRVNDVLARVTLGDFRPRVQVPNRDEFGTLSKNLNSMIQELSVVYDDLRSLNDNLQKRVDEQVKELDRATSLKRYLSPQLADSILAGGKSIDLTSRREDLTILFSDIRGFTPMSERMEPEELVDLLNRYLTAMTEIVFENGGTLDKYVGDALMVFFGNPVPYDDNAARAVKTALSMRHRLTELQREWFARSEETLNIGVGITTGYVTVGNIGSPARADYTVLGNNVNLASRLADRAAPGQILVSERTFVAVRDLVQGTEVERVELKGVSRPIRIFEVQEQ